MADDSQPILEGIPETVFDFEAHRRDAETAYQRIRPLYDAFAKTVHDILQQSLVAARVNVASIEHRAKQTDSFGRKAAEPSAGDTEKPKYSDPPQADHGYGRYSGHHLLSAYGRGSR